MKLIAITEESIKILNQLSHHALKGAGMEAFQAVKALESWLGTAFDNPTEESK